MLNIHEERRRIIGEELHNLTRTRGPLRADQKKRFAALLLEHEDLEDKISRENVATERRAFEAYVRGGKIDLNALRVPERRDMLDGGKATGAATGAGVLVPIEWANAVDSAMKDVGPMLDLITIEDTPSTGTRKLYPSDNDTSVTAYIVGEGGQDSAQDVNELNQVALQPYMFRAGVLASYELAADVEFDLSGWLAQRFGVRLARALNQYFTTGAGSGQPTGWLTTAIARNSIIASSNSNRIGFIDFASVERKLDQAYRPGSVWLMSANTLSSLRQATDSEGAALYPDLHRGDTPRIMNREVVLTPTLTDLQTQASSPAVTTYPIAIGNLKYYRARKGPQVFRALYERYADTQMVLYHLLSRWDGALCDGFTASDSGAGAVQVMSVTY